MSSRASRKQKRSSLDKDQVRSRLSIFLKLFFIFGSALLLSTAIGESYRWMRLKGNTQSALAKVTQAQDNPCSGLGCSSPYRHRIKYKFSSMDGAEYVYTGQFIIGEQWVRIPAATYESAIAQSTIPVIYSTQDPRVSQPSILARPAGTNVAGLCVLAIVSVVVAASYWRNRSI